MFKIRKFARENFFVILVAFMALALFLLRFVRLTILPVFADEAIYIRWAQVMKAEETLRFLPLSDGKEPLFMWVAMFFLRIIHDPLLAARIESVVCGFATMIGIGLLSWLLFKNKKVVVVSVLIYSVLPFAFFFDRLSLVDSMLAMFGVWTFIFAYLSFTKERLDFAMLAGFALGGAWLTKSPALFFALLLPTLWVFIKSPKSIFRIFPLTLVTVIIGYGLYNILRLGPNFELIASRNLDYVYPISHILKSPLNPLVDNLKSVANWIWLMGGVGIIALWIYGLYVNFRKYWKQCAILIIWLLGPVFAQAEYAKVFTARYVLFSLPFFIIIAASAFADARKLSSKILMVLVIILIAQSIIFDFNLLTNPARAALPRSERSGYLEDWTNGAGIKDVAEYIVHEQSLHPDKKIVIGTEGYFGTLPDGLEIYLNSYPKITVIGVGLNFSDVPQPLLDSQKSGNTTYLVINNDRFKGDWQKEGLKLVASYPKAQKPDGTHETLMFFELPLIGK